jgi:hypothetical protein
VPVLSWPSSGGRKGKPRRTRIRTRRHTARKIRGYGQGEARNRRASPREYPRSPPRLDRRPLPDRARRATALRANPYPEVTDPTCRLPLPTLFYRLEAIHLGDLLRIWVRTGATSPRCPHLNFQGPRGRSGHRRIGDALRAPSPISPLWDSRALERSSRKDNSLRTSRRRLQATLGHPDEHTRERERFLIRFRCRVPELQPDSLSPEGCFI